MENIYQIKMTLQGTQPPIWRLFQVPGRFTFYDLHRVIQRLMGWTDYDHLHEFEVGQVRIGTPSHDVLFFKLNEVKDEERLTLERVISTTVTNFLYTYDFGDNWVHELSVEKVIASEEPMEYPVCLDGQRAGPPEDIGGFWGYEDALQKFKRPRPKNPEDAGDETPEEREWLDFDPEHFDLEEINQSLKYIQATDIDSLVEALPDDEGTSLQTVVRRKKIGRNEPCPCGSGKKYKKCCGK